MARTTRRGLFRLALVLMIGWNLLVFWFSFRSINHERYVIVSSYLQAEADCAKVRPFTDCRAEYEKFVGGYSQWDELKKQFRPFDIAVIELLPPIAIGILWGALWGIRATVLWVLRGFGIQVGKPRELGESVTVLERLRGIGRWFITPKNMLAFSAVLVALAVSYYFLSSLPASNRERLQFEKDSAAAAKAERDNKEAAASQAAQEREGSFQLCSAAADMAYSSYVQLNGKEVPGQPGTYRAPSLVWSDAEKRKADALAECHRQYDLK